jgi:hypothetical protein
MGNDMLPKEWVEELCTRMARLLDENETENHQLFEEGFAAGVAHANDDEINPK